MNLVESDTARRLSLLAILLCLFIFPFIFPSAVGRTIVVDDDSGWWSDFPTIGEGVVNASAGDTIRIYSGNYSETVNITKSLDIIGNGTEDTLISSSADVFIVSADDVSISGLSFLQALPGTSIQFEFINGVEVSNCTFYGDKEKGRGNAIVGSSSVGLTIYNCTFDGTGRSIDLDQIVDAEISWSLFNRTEQVIDGADGFVIHDSAFTGGTGFEASGTDFEMLRALISGSAGDGISLSISNSMLRDLIIIENDGSGIRLASSGSLVILDNRIMNNNISGLSVIGSDDMIIEGNRIAGCLGSGIALHGTNSTNVTGNIITANGRTGIVLRDGSLQNSISSNWISSNGMFGISMPEVDGQTVNNTVFSNSFSSNGLNSSQAYDAVGNQWDDGLYGNHWSDDAGADDNSDGMSDDPYGILGGHSEDSHPRRTWNGSLNHVPEPSVLEMSPNPGWDNQTFFFDSDAFDLDGSVDHYIWNSSLDGILYAGGLSEFEMTGLSVGNHSITLVVMDDRGRWSSELAVAQKLVVEHEPLDPVIVGINPDEAIEGDEITLEAGWARIATYTWWSDIDGVLYSGPLRTITVDGLSNGTHEILLNVSRGDRTSVNVVKRIHVNGIPIIGKAFATPTVAEWKQTISLSAHAIDDGLLTYIWSSNLTGQLYNGFESSQFIYDLDPGVHNISLMVVDNNGTQSSGASFVIIVNRAPSISILSPLSGSKHSRGFGVSGSASDPDGHDLAIQWSLDDGGWNWTNSSTISFYINASDVEDGVHRLKFRAWDGYHHSDVVEITVTTTGRENGESGNVLPVSAESFQFIILAFLLVGLAGFSRTGVGTYIISTMMLPMYNKLRDEKITDQATRGKLVEYIRKNPGAHFSQIKHDMKMSNGSLGYHLRVLETSGFIRSRSDGFYKRFYPHGFRIPEFVLDPTEMQITEIVGDRPGISQQELAWRMDLSAATISHHIKRLKKKKVVVASRAEGVRLTDDYLGIMETDRMTGKVIVGEPIVVPAESDDQES